MKPYMAAVEYFAKNEALEEFGVWLNNYCENGVVVSTPEYFLMAKGIPRAALNEDILNPAKFWPKEEQDCWYLAYAAGSIGDMSKICPYFLPWLAFHRIGYDPTDLRVYSFRNINKISQGFKKG